MPDVELPGQLAQKSEVRSVCARGQCVCCGHSTHASLPALLLKDPGTQGSHGLAPVNPGAQRQARGPAEPGGLSVCAAHGTHERFDDAPACVEKALAAHASQVPSRS